MITPAHRRRQLPGGWQLAVPVVAALAGGLFVASAVSSAGTDLRSSNTDLQTLVDTRAETVDALRERVEALQSEVDRIGAGVAGQAVRDVRRRVAAAEPAAGLTAASGVGLAVTLDDAPLDPPPQGADPADLVVHQQDLQAVVNAMWAGGALAISLQDQRLVSTTGIKCVGNTVVLEGIPYAPPYRIEAVGDPGRLLRALNGDETIDRYREYVEAYGLGLAVTTAERLTLAAYEGEPSMEYAEPA